MAEVLAAGAPLARARAAAILVHGRGASAEDILTLADEFAQDDIAYLAPQAAGRSWYPYSFLAPLEQNEPHLSNALATVGSTLDHVAREGFTSERIVLIGFSQGGCLALEYVARNARRYGAIAGLSAGLIGPLGHPARLSGVARRNAGVPRLLRCRLARSAVRVQESRDVLSRMGAAVTERIYPGMGHTVNADEIAHVARLLAGIAALK